MTLFNCPECNKQISDKAEICAGCGAIVDSKFRQIKHGGFVVYEKNGHGLVVATEGLGEMDWNSAITACNELRLNGYSDWYLPSQKELNALYVNLKPLGDDGFASYYCWSSTEYDDDSAWNQYFSSGNQYNYAKYLKCYVRAVRAF